MFKCTAAYCKVHLFVGHCRSFLSTGFKLSDSWKIDSILKTLSQKHDAYNYPGNINSIECGILANNLFSPRDRDSVNFVKLLMRLKSLSGSKNVLEATNNSVLRHIFDMDNISYLSFIYENRLDNGLYIDDYSACYILNQLAGIGEYKFAAKIVAHKILDGNLHNKLTATLALYVLYMFIKKNSQLEKKDVNEISDKKNIRVKYVPNTYNNYYDNLNFNDMVGLSLITVTARITTESNNILLNMKILGLMLSGRYEDVVQIFNKSSQSFYKDILQLCLIHEEEKLHSNMDIIKIIKNKLYDEKKLNCNFLKDLRIYVQDIVSKVEPMMVQDQMLLNDKWLIHLEGKLKEYEINREKKLQLKNFQHMYESSKSRKKEVWFFEDEEEINLKIKNLRPKYPKIWLGKKKSPKLIDNEYVPPEIGRMSN